MNWLNTVNTVTCMLLLFALLAPAALAGRLRHKLSLAPITLIVGLQAIDPIVEWLPDMAWPGVALNVALVFTVALYRKELWHMVRASFDPEHPPRGRRSDRGGES